MTDFLSFCSMINLLENYTNLLNISQNTIFDLLKYFQHTQIALSNCILMTNNSDIYALRKLSICPNFIGLKKNGRNICLAVKSAVFIIFPQQSLRFLQSFNSSGQLYMHVAWSDLAKVDTKNLRQQYDIVSSTIFTKPCAPHCPYNYAVSLKRISLLTCVYPFMWWHFFIAFIAAPTLLANENGKER